MKDFLKRVITAPLYAVAAVVVLLEDWLWDDLQRFAEYLGHLPVFHQLEAFVVRLPPAGALAVFLVPTVLLFPVKLVALWLVSGGHVALGVLTMVAAKIVGTALVARIFKLTKPKLLQFSWFAKIYQRITLFKMRIYERLKSTAVYQHLLRLRLNIRESWLRFKTRRKSWLRRRWRALRKFWRLKRND
ncbi:hypothetical protein [Turneriella parva]|uniref:Transmembrane protein n=1 Tax=Turneriella parva (strain ATCC BAA-1111 / DSM 21527 / NCTC 11395 / H) TaxID=869212 RepID=I4B7Y2_TURPD|nr:hypothetical protein [Turneriella parva]AFM13389.1 transmembrane protein [Turneriella parva DSM 21527]